MSNLDLISIFHECLERVMAGEAIEASIKDFPQHAGILRSMLETSLIVRRIRVPAAETAEAQAKMRPRIDEALRTVSVQRAYPPRSILKLVAGLLIVCLVIGGSGLFAQNSLPGDALYGIKLLTENVQLVVSGGSDDLRGQFAQRRVTEIQTLIALERVETVIFQGILTASDGTSWRVAGLNVQVSDGTPGAKTVEIGDLIEVRGVTENGVIAQEIRLIKAGDDSTPPLASPTMTPTLSQTPPASATVTPSVTPSSTPSARPGATASASLTESPTRIFMTAIPSCGVVPDGWVIYRVRIGDTLSLLSSSRGITLATLMAVNCLTDPRMIIVGQELYLPPGAEIPPGVQPPGGSDTSPPATRGDDDDDDDDDGGDDDD